MRGIHGLSEVERMVTIAQFISEQYPATDEVQCITLYIPQGDEFKALAAGLLALATNPLNYDEPDSAQAEGLAAIWDDAYSQIDWGGCMTPAQGQQSRMSLFHRWVTVGVGSATVNLTIDAAVMHAFYSEQTPAATGDEWYYDVWLPAGDYQMRILYFRRTNNGQLTLDLLNQDGGSDVGLLTAQELFGTTLRNQIIAIGFTVVDAGHYRLRGGIGSKNVSSTGFACPLTTIELWKEGD